MQLYNTLGRELQEFRPINDGMVKIYTCGPTVYDYQHIGNYSGYIYWDILIRLLQSKDLEVQRVMNITDVGHLTSDEDEGEDKLEKGAAREGKTAREVADYYTEDFLASMKALKLLKPTVYAKATDYIDAQIDIIQNLVDKGFAYKTDQAIYFDVTKLSDYGKLTGQKLDDKEIGARSEVVTDGAKRHPQDFAVWFFTVGRFEDHEMHWSSPWGDGFPGWHIECSAIVHATLGEPIDIHTGGIDHIGTHHTNEIAQTEAAFDTKLSNFWIHNNHMMVDGKKISKSSGNGFTLKDLAEKGFSPMDFKMLVLQSHYRSQSNFTWDALDAAKTNLNNLRAWAALIFQSSTLPEASTQQSDELISSVVDSLESDLNTSKALANIYNSVNLMSPSSVLLKAIDGLLGLDLSDQGDISKEQKDTLAKRESARKASRWEESDSLRKQLETQGIGLRDTEQGAIWHRL